MKLSLEMRSGLEHPNQINLDGDIGAFVQLEVIQELGAPLHEKKIKVQLTPNDSRRLYAMLSALQGS